MDRSSNSRRGSGEKLTRQSSRADKPDTSKCLAGQMLESIVEESRFGGNSRRALLEEWRKTHEDLGVPFVQCIIDKLRAETRSGERKVAAPTAPLLVPLPQLPVEMLSHAFTFLDMEDIPAVAATCREWKNGLNRAEDELWLMLVRHYHPALEQITKLLAKEGIGGGGETVVASSQDADSEPGGTQSLPAPSLNWKRQFQRRHSLLRNTEAERATASEPETPPPRALSAYIAQVDFTCYIDGNNDVPRKKVGIVSTVVETLIFNERERVELRLEDLRSSFSRMKKFDSFEITVNLIERSTGRQTVVFNGELDHPVVDEFCFFGKFENFNIVPLLAGMPDLSLDSCVWLERKGCVCRCEERTVFTPSTCHCERCERCHCCTCKVQWSCFYRFILRLEIHFDVEFDFVELGKHSLLTVLQEGLVYS